MREGIAAGLEVGLEPERGLIAESRVFLEKLEDDVRDLLGHRLFPLVRGDGGHGDMRVHEFHRLRVAEGESPGEGLIEGHPERVEIRAEIHRLVDPPGLLGRHVGESPLKARVADEFLDLVPEHGREGEIDETRARNRRLDDDVRALDVAEHEALRVRVDDDARELTRELEERGKVGLVLMNVFGKGYRLVFFHDDRLARLEGDEVDVADNPRMVEFLDETELLLEFGEFLPRGVLLA